MLQSYSLRLHVRVLKEQGQSDIAVMELEEAIQGLTQFQGVNKSEICRAMRWLGYAHSDVSRNKENLEGTTRQSWSKEEIPERKRKPSGKHTLGCNWVSRSLFKQGLSQEAVSKKLLVLEGSEKVYG